MQLRMLLSSSLSSAANSKQSEHPNVHGLLSGTESITHDQKDLRAGVARQNLGRPRRVRPGGEGELRLSRQVVRRRRRVTDCVVLRHVLSIKVEACDRDRLALREV